MTKQLKEFQLTLFQSAENTRIQTTKQYEAVQQKLEELEAKYREDQGKLFQELEAAKTDLLRSQGASAMITKMIIEEYEIDPSVEQVDIQTGKVIPREGAPQKVEKEPKVVTSPTKVVKPEEVIMPPVTPSASYISNGE